MDASGHPFLIQGDSPWSLIVELTREEVDLYLDDRRAKGFNTLLVNLIEHNFSRDPPRNVYGHAPFVSSEDYSTPNEPYFSHADWVIHRAGEKGFLVLLTPSYLGYGGGKEGWYSDMVRNGATKLREYGRYLGRRYKNFSNILWMHGGDYNPPDRSLVREIADGIREFDTRALHSAHCAPETGAIDYWGKESWLQVNNVYTYGPVYAKALQQHARAEKMPFFLLESNYENEHGTTPQGIRTQAYHALLSGAAGQIYGNNPIWHFDGPGIEPSPYTWKAALDSPGAKSMAHARTLFTSLRWWTLEPDSANELLRGGIGSDKDRAVAARTADHSSAIAYLPATRSISVNLGLLTGPWVAAWWYDPSSGAYLTVAGSPFRASGVQAFRPKGNNGSGYSDWVLVLHSRS